MSERSSRQWIWDVPIHIVAGALAVVSVLAGLLARSNAQLEPGISAVQYALASASLTFTIARIVRTRRVMIRELELIAIAIGGLVLREVFRQFVALAFLVGIVVLVISSSC